MKYLFLSMSILFGSTAMAYSTLECTSNQKILYSNNSKVGGAHPFPGMITNVEEVMIQNVVTYRLVQRESCDGNPQCEVQNPELVDIIPTSFSFNFYPNTKITLAQNGTLNSPIFEEDYAIQFRMDHIVNIWMLCHYTRMLLP